MDTVAWIFIGLFNTIVIGYQNSLYISNLREFMDYKPEINEKQTGLTPKKRFSAGEEELSFRNISFSYKGQQEPSLKQISLTLRHGEKIALVGQNGAGKTTFIKLLLRLYDPSDGSIQYGGTDIRQLDLPAYRRLFATAFQDYQVFSMTVAENVLMRKVSAADVSWKKGIMRH